MKKWSVFIFVGLMGCAVVDPEPSWQNVQTLNDSRIGVESTWVRKEADQEIVEQTVAAMLVDGLTREECLRIAVLKNLRLQAHFNDLGVSTAAVVEASLPTNPTLDGWLGLPGRSGASSLGLVAWLSDLWIIPERTAVAELMAKRTEYVVAMDIMATAMSGAASWDRLVAARRDLSLSQDLLRVRQDLAKRVAIRYAQGLDETAMVQESIAMIAEQRVALQEAKQRVTEAKTEIVQVLSTPDVWQHVSTGADLLPMPSRTMKIEDALEEGMALRLDLLASRNDVEQSTRAIGLEDALIWRSVSLGTSKEGQFAKVYDSNVEADEAFGPTISIEIPIFNQNQAGRATASFELQRSIKLLEFARMRATKEIIDAFQQFKNADFMLAELERGARPALQKRLRYLEEWNKKMQVTYLDVLSARATLIAIKMEINRSREQRNISWRALEYATKGGAM